MKKKNNKKLLINILVFVIVFVLFVSLAAAFTAEETDRYNKIMMDIYNDIENNVPNYDRLYGFDETALSFNDDGVYKIDFNNIGKDKTVKRIPLSMGLTILGLDEPSPYEEERNSFNFSFPLLGIKFSGYQNYIKRRGFDIKNFMKKSGIELWDEQQREMPYKLFLKADKDSFKVGEPIVFTVTLKNDTKKHLRFKELNEKTLFFQYDGGSWGTEDITMAALKRVKDVIVRMGKSTSAKLTAEGFYEPGEYEIVCSYVMTYKGIKPTGTLKVKVVE